MEQSLKDQLVELMGLANKNGLYDAADYLKQQLNVDPDVFYRVRNWHYRRMGSSGSFYMVTANSEIEAIKKVKELLSVPDNDYDYLGDLRIEETYENLKTPVWLFEWD